MQTQTNYNVVVENKLLLGQYTLDRVEKAVVYLALQSVDQSIMISESREFEVTAKQLSSLLDIDISDAYFELKKAATTIFNRSLIYEEHTETGLRKITHQRIVESCSYCEGAGYVTLKFASSILPLLFDLKKNYTTLKLQDIAQLTNGYVIRLFEIFLTTRFRMKCSKVSIKLADLMERLELPEGYRDNYGMFNVRILQPTIEQLRSNKLVDVTLVTHKKVRKIDQLTFNCEWF
jgi:plasmid replication initiation protein